MNSAGEIWEEKVSCSSSEQQMRSAFQNGVPVPFVIDGLGLVGVELTEFETTTAPERMLNMIGTVEKPIPRLVLFWLPPKEMAVYRVVITCFPEKPGKGGIAEITLLETRAI